jgi:hypothetical protein
MYPVSNTVKALFAAEQAQVLRITGDGISITDANIVMDSFTIDRFSCNTQKLEIGTAISAESAPSEDDFGLGDEGPMDGGDDLFGEDTGSSGDLGLDGMDDEIPEEGGEGGDDIFGDAGTDEQANEGGKDGGDLGDMPDGDFDLGL